MIRAKEPAIISDKQTGIHGEWRKDRYSRLSKFRRKDCPPVTGPHTPPYREQLLTHMEAGGRRWLSELVAVHPSLNSSFRLTSLHFRCGQDYQVFDALVNQPSHAQVRASPETWLKLPACLRISWHTFYQKQLNC